MILMMAIRNLATSSLLQTGTMSSAVFWLNLNRTCPRHCSCATLSITIRPRSPWTYLTINNWKKQKQNVTIKITLKRARNMTKKKTTRNLTLHGKSGLKWIINKSKLNNCINYPWKDVLKIKRRKNKKKKRMLNVMDAAKLRFCMHND